MDYENPYKLCTKYCFKPTATKYLDWVKLIGYG